MINQLFQVIKFIINTNRKANGRILYKINFDLILMKQAEDLADVLLKNK